MLAKSPNAGEWLFCYGTLRDDDTYRLVTGRKPGVSAQAELAGWRRFDLPVVPYPGAISVKYPASIVGTLRAVRDADEWATLDDYEGDEYTREDCVVSTYSGSVTACIYRFNHSSMQIAQPSSRAALEAFADSIFKRPMSPEVARTFVGTLHGAPIAAARFETRVDKQTGEEQAWLEELFVAAALRRLGFGRVLLERALEELRGSGIATVRAEVAD